MLVWAHSFLFLEVLCVCFESLIHLLVFVNQSIMPPTTQPDLELGNEQTPLLSSGDDGLLTEIPKFTFREKVVAFFSACTFGTSTVSLIVSMGNPFVYVSGFLGVIVAPYAVFQQNKITQIQALKETNERVEREVNTLSEQNEELHKNVNELRDRVNGLKAQEKKLKKINSVRGTSLKALEAQVEESRQVLAHMKENVVGDILANLIDVLYNCDDNEDDFLQDDEIEKIINKFERMNGVDINDEKIKALIIQHGRSTDAVIELITNLLSDDIPKDSTLFTVL